jgi:diacylglycerol kinase family enzyme
LRAHVIVNRRARQLVHASPLLAELCRPRPGIEVIETSSLAEVDAAARALLSLDQDAVVLAGGDGTYMAGVSALVRAAGDAPLPPIALAPGGTVSTVARNWGMKGDPIRYAARLLDGIANDSIRATRRPTLHVREGSGVERVGFIFGAGLVARFFEIYESRGAGGNVAAAKIVARIFAGSFVGSRFARSVLDPTPCSIEIDGVAARFDHVSLLCASVVRDLGLGLRLVYRAGEELDRFHVVATPLGPRLLAPQMPLVLAARPLLGSRVDALAKELALGFEHGRGAYVLDGDLFRADAITVTRGPVLRLLG